MTHRSVVLTGIGAVTSLGIGIPSLAAALREGRSGISLLRSLDTGALPTKGGAEITEPLPQAAGLPLHAPRYLQLAAWACEEARRMAGLESLPNKQAVGVLLGTSRGPIREVEQLCALHRQGVLHTEGAPLLQALFPGFSNSLLSSAIARLCGAEGRSLTLSAACASGTIAIGEGARWIREGSCDIVIAGGAEAPFTPLSFAGVCASKAMSANWADPAAACRPFDRTRDGYVMGEGAGILILEAEEHARARGAKPLAKVLGYAQTSDAGHITVPTGDGLRRAIGDALRDAGVTPGELDYINAHGTSTVLNDKWETWAVRKALGDAADRVPISSTKGMTGHLLGAAGAVEAILCLLAMEGGFLPPTLNLREPDPDCDLDYVPNQARPALLSTVLTQSLGFGGHNAALVLARS